MAFALAAGATACSKAVIARGPIHWVWSGAMTETTAVVKAKVGAGAGVPRLVIDGRTVDAVAMSDSGVATFRINGLPPETRLDFHVEVGDSSMNGRLHTVVAGPMSFKFVFGSCARTGSSHRVFASMQATEPLFTLHMGDFHYENIATNEVAAYRRAFDEVLASETQSSLYRSAAIAYVWDDHDYGPNDADGTHPGREAALQVYDEYVPHFPLDRSGDLPRDLHQAFTVGRVRFLLTDVRSHRTPDDEPDGPGKTMLGQAQREWLLREIEDARGRYALVVWVNPVPWITPVGSGHGWGRYAWERRFIADRIRDAGMVRRLVMLSGDAHMVAIDDGTNSNFAEDAPPGDPGFPVVHAAPLDRYPRYKGGPYSHGVAGRRLFFGLIQIQQFGLAEIEDDGDVLRMTLSGRDGRGEALTGMSLTLRCDAIECRPDT